jgi:hypothetical protein
MNSDIWSGSVQQPEGFAAGLSMGMLEAKRWSVLRALQLRFRGLAPADLSASIRSMDDCDRLDVWYDAAVTAPCLDTFRGMIGQFHCTARV